MDNRVSLENGINSLKNADIIYLLGGNPFIQLEYLQKNKFDLIIQNTSALIIGVSAGSMNLATNSYYSKDEDYPESVIYKGLGITDITIDPHFDINNEEQVKEIKANSKNIKIIGLPNDSAIVISNNNIYIKKVSINNDEFIESLKQYDNLIKNTEDKTTILTAEKQILSKYEELIINNE